MHLWGKVVGGIKLFQSRRLSQTKKKLKQLTTNEFFNKKFFIRYLLHLQQSKKIIGIERSRELHVMHTWAHKSVY